MNITYSLLLRITHHIFSRNVQLGPRGWSGLKAEPDSTDSLGELANEKEIEPTLMKTPNWHKDSYPVCFLFLFVYEISSLFFSSSAVLLIPISLSACFLVCLHPYALRIISFGRGTYCHTETRRYQLFLRAAAAGSRHGPPRGTHFARCVADR